MMTAIHWEQKNINVNLIDFLLNAPEFNMLSYDDLEMLDKVMLVDNYADGHKFKSGSNVYLVIEGEVSVTHKRNCGTLQFNRMHSGELFGLYSLIDDSKRLATCKAVGLVRAASIPRSAFELLFRSSLPLANHFQRIAAHQRGMPGGR